MQNKYIYLDVSRVVVVNCSLALLTRIVFVGYTTIMLSLAVHVMDEIRYKEELEGVHNRF
jgi:hypothetical protein